jgi:phosphatidylinositol-3-phosphatase
MSHVRCLGTLGVFALLTTLGSSNASAQQVKTVFVIAMENHNWTQPTQLPGGIQQVYGNVNAPFINSLVNGTAYAIVNGSLVNISEQVAYATAYHNVLATPSGNNPSIHPSEPNYLWAEAGTNFGIFNDDDPFKDTPPNSQSTPLHLSTLLRQAGKTWRSYQEDIDLSSAGGVLCNNPLPQDQWTVPLTSFSGHFGCGTFNAYNLSTQYNYAAKHNPMVFFDDTNGGNNAAPTNPFSQNYAPLQQLATDLANDTVADYNWITPDQFNDMHTSLTGGYQGLTGDAANIKQGDDFLRQIVPVIMASNAYKNHGVIILWWDESESDGTVGDNANDFNHTIGEIIISDRTHPNVNGLPYASPVNYTHSSDLRTMLNIFRMGPYPNDAANADDLSDLFKPGSVPKKP